MNFVLEEKNIYKNSIIFLFLVCLCSCSGNRENREEYIQDSIEYTVNDPFEPFNRAMFEFDTGLNFILDPAVDIYEFILPEKGRNGVRNIFRNFRSPIYLTNSILQGDPKGTAVIIGRFIVNSTIGVLGFFDVASHLGMPYQLEDFGQTLAKWGIGDGFYIYVPILGPSNLRDLSGYVLDTGLLEPISWIARADNPYWVSIGYSGTFLVDLRSNVRGTLRELDNSSLDYYAALRSAYLQNRKELISNGKNNYQTEEYTFD